jgi:hypothetical protein
MTVTAPPRPPRPSDPVTHAEFEALVEALIEEAKQRQRRRRRIYMAVAAGVTLVSFAVLTIADRTTGAQTASRARRSAAAGSAAASAKIAFVNAGCCIVHDILHDFQLP